jgi:GntR family transcriptional regulator
MLTGAAKGYDSGDESIQMTEQKRQDSFDLLGTYSRPMVAGISKYAQLRDMLTAAIHAGHWKPGAQLPPERDLVRMTGLSLGTVQRALRELVSEGLLVRSQGSGTYVAEGPRAIDAPLHLRFLGERGEPRYLPVFPKLISRTLIEERGPWSEWLRQTGRDIVRLDRRVRVGDEFQVFNRFYLNAQMFPDVAAAPLAGLDGANLKPLLNSKMNVRVADVRQRVGLEALSEEAASAIGVKPGTYGLHLESATSSGRLPLYFEESFIPPNNRRLDVSCS